MRTLLGTLTVYVDKFDSETPSACKVIPEPNTPLTEWPTKYEIELHPACDRDIRKGLTNLSDEEFTRTILCHELGHFVGFLMHDKTQHPMYQAIEGSLDGERVAWDNANLMNVPLDPTIKRRCLQSYIDGAAEESKDGLLSTLRDISREIARDKGVPWVKRLTYSETVSPLVLIQLFLMSLGLVTSLVATTCALFNLGRIAKAFWLGIDWLLATFLRSFKFRLAFLAFLGIVCWCGGARAGTIPIHDNYSAQLDGSGTTTVVEEVPFFLGTCFLFGLGWIARTESQYRDKKRMQERAAARVVAEARLQELEISTWESEGGALYLSLPRERRGLHSVKTCPCIPCKMRRERAHKIARIMHSKYTHVTVFCGVVVAMAFLGHSHVFEALPGGLVAGKGVDLLGEIVADRMLPESLLRG